MNGLIDRLFNQHKLVRRGLILMVVFAIAWSMSHIIPTLETDDAKVTALGIVFGLLGPVLGLYQWSRSREGKNVRNSSENGEQ